MANRPFRLTTAVSRRIVISSLALSAISGCTLRRRIAEKQVKQLGAVDPTQHREMALSPTAPYVIEPPDQLSIRVKPDDFGTFPLESVVAQDGMADLGFVGRVYLAGLSVDHAEAVIAQRLEEYARQNRITVASPLKVSIKVDESKSKYYYVMGKGVQQARFPVSGRDTVLDAVMTAQIKSNALLEKTYVVRPHPGGLPDKVMAVDWLAIRDRGDTTTNYQLFPGDRLVIPGGPEPGLVETLFGSR
ncbi:MAG: polysaccharide biosynthesis/export family protein [bacterium]